MRIWLVVANENGAVSRWGTEPGDGQWQCYYRMDNALPKAKYRGPKGAHIESKSWEGKPRRLALRGAEGGLGAARGPPALEGGLGAGSEQSRRAQLDPE